jgi:hypothetical protein
MDRSRRVDWVVVEGAIALLMILGHLVASLLGWLH